MNRKQRDSNRRTAEWLRHQKFCTECGERGLHYVIDWVTVADIMAGRAGMSGFWTCAKFYGPDGRKIQP